MNPRHLRNLLEDLTAGRTSVEEVERRLATLPFEQLEFACVDHHRALRCGFPEVIFGQGKTPEQVVAIAERLVAQGHDLLATRIGLETATALQQRFAHATYYETARAAALRHAPAEPGEGLVGIVCAGTSDLPVAEEARVTAEMLGARVEPIYDVGVAGLHRLLARSADLRAANALVVVAGMEGALPSVIGGLVEAPVIAVPTSVGYGANFHGLAALLTMLNSCASGVSVVNIDNGFGAGYQAALINRLAVRGGRASVTSEAASTGPVVRVAETSADRPTKRE